jgi:predicted HTH transcriptional regulator
MSYPSAYPNKTVAPRDKNGFESFLALTAHADREFLSLNALHRFLPVCCGMANGAGGWVILGAFQEGDTFLEDRPEAAVMQVKVEGVPDTAQLERELRLSLEDRGQISANPVSSFRSLSIGDKNGDKNVLVARVEAADWFLRPLCVGADYLRGAYRRIGGADVASGHHARLRMALDALEITRDDLPVQNLGVSDLDAGSVASFRAAVTERFPQWKELSQEEFLRRALVLTPLDPLQASEEITVTRAGELLLGKGEVRVRLTRRDESQGTKVWEAQNLWSAWTDLFLPRLAKGAPCEDALRECFMNALLHAEHDEGCVEIELRDATVTFLNPGLPRVQIDGPRPDGTSSEGVCPARNGRLLRMFKLAGLAHGEGRGLPIIRAFHENFHLQLNTLELSTFAELPLQEPDIPPGMPIVQVSQVTQAPRAAQVPQVTQVPRAVQEVPEATQAPSPQKSPSLLDLMPLLLAPIERAIPPGLILAALPVTQPATLEIAELEVAELEVLEPEAPEPEIAEPEILEPESQEPEEPEPESLEPEGFEPESFEPDSFEPESLTPVNSEPESLEPEVLEPEVLEDEEPNLEPENLEEPEFFDAETGVTEEEKEEKEEEEEEEETGEDEEENEEDEYEAPEVDISEISPESSAQEQVLRSARTSPPVVRQAILELCGEYRSLSALSSMLARSEGSLRRHYITAMVREGLLEMEFPDRVGHPDQRYRTRNLN